jgi:hypothetical protein
MQHVLCRPIMLLTNEVVGDDCGDLSWACQAGFCSDKQILPPCMDLVTLSNTTVLILLTSSCCRQPKMAAGARLAAQACSMCIAPHSQTKIYMTRA